MGEHSYPILFDPGIGAQIIALYESGESLSAICRQPGMPSVGTVSAWIKDSKQHKESFEAARQVRAMQFEEKVIAEADAIPQYSIPEDAAGTRVKIETYKWAAEMADPTRYGKKMTHQGDPDKPITFRVITGVPAPTEAQLPPSLNQQGLIVTTGKPVAEMSPAEFEAKVAAEASPASPLAPGGEIPPPIALVAPEGSGAAQGPDSEAETLFERLQKQPYVPGPAGNPNKAGA